MATEQLSTTVWIENAAQYTAQHMGSPKAQIALEIYAMALEAAALLRTPDYVTTLDWEALIQDSDELNRWMNPDQIRAAEVSIRFATADVAGATVPASLDTKIENSKKLLEYDDERLMRAKLYLIGKLAEHAA
jgi:hypothetical protein